jgi:adenylate cyclase class 2
MEIETKIKVKSLETIAESLRALGACCQCQVIQRDAYLDTAEDALMKTDRGLRRRRQQDDEGKKVFLTFKGPREKGPFKSRREIEVEAGDFAAMSELLSARGFCVKLTFEKRRRVWPLDDCCVCLDQLPLLGDFVEVEGPDEQRINNVLIKLGLLDLEHIGQTYAVMMADKLSQLSIDKKEVFFNDSSV